MKSLNELAIIQNDLIKQKSNMLRTLSDETKTYISSVIDTCFEDVSSSIVKISDAKEKLKVECIKQEFLTGLFSDDAFLKFLTSYTHTNVTSTMLEDVLKTGKSIDTKASKSEVNTKSTGEMSSYDFSNLLGNPVFKSNNIFGTSERSKTKSPEYVVRYNKKSDTYKIMYRDENEVVNIYTLYDFFANKKFKHHVDGLEKLTTLGVNIMSLKGFPDKNGYVSEDRGHTDFIFSSDKTRAVTRSSMINVDLSKASYTSYFVYNNVLIKSFLSALKYKGYGELLFRYLWSMVSTLSKEDNDSIFKSFYITSEKVKKEERVLISVSNLGSIVFPSSVYLKKDVIFTIMYHCIECICESNKSLNIEDLLKCVKFYGGHDFVAQGEDINNFFNEEANFSVTAYNKSEVINKEEVAKETSEFVSYESVVCGAGCKPKKIRLSDVSGKTVVIDIEDLNRSIKRNVFTALDVLVEVLSSLMSEWKIPLKELCKPNSYLLSLDCITTTPHKTLTHIDLKDGTYYCVNKNLGWGNLNSEIPKLFTNLNYLGLKLEYSFE